jgi:tether containing UBX domain for GLUT4
MEPRSRAHSLVPVLYSRCMPLSEAHSSPKPPRNHLPYVSLSSRHLIKPNFLGQPPRFTYPEHPPPQSATKKPKASSSKPIIPPANYGYVRGGPTAGLMGGTGGKESLNDLGLVPQSVLMVKWEDEAMDGGSLAHRNDNGLVGLTSVVTGYPAPLLSELMEKVVPLPPAAPKDVEETKKVPASSSSGTGTGENKIPK